MCQVGEIIFCSLLFLVFASFLIYCVVSMWKISKKCYIVDDTSKYEKSKYENQNEVEVIVAST
jgi:hypothetical protein